MKLSIIMPVYNEVDLVGKVLERLNTLKIKNVDKEIIVIDGDSTDGTKQLLRNYQKDYHFKLLSQGRYRGKGAAVKRGLKKVTGQIVIIQDGDLEYDINDYPKLLKPILKNQTMFVLGSRLLNGHQKPKKSINITIYSFVLSLGRVLYTNFFNFLYGVRLTDPGTMYKVFKIDCLEGINLKSNRFDLDWELVAKLVKKGCVPHEVSISYQPRTPKEGKKVKFFKDATQIFIAIIRFRFTN